MQGQYLPKVHVTSPSGRNKWAPSHITAAKTVTVRGDFFSLQPQSTEPVELLAVRGEATAVHSSASNTAKPRVLCTAGPLLPQCSLWLSLLSSRTQKLQSEGARSCPVFCISYFYADVLCQKQRNRGTRT